jgi:hypothetical protein
LHYPFLVWTEHGKGFNFEIKSNLREEEQNDNNSNTERSALWEISGLSPASSYNLRTVIYNGTSVVASNVQSVKTLPASVLDKYFIISDTIEEDTYNDVAFIINKSTLFNLIEQYNLISILSQDELNRVQSIKVNLIDPYGGENFIINSLST